MAIDRDAMNTALDREILAAPSRQPPDYLRDAAAFQAVIDRLLSDENWLVTYTNAGGVPTRNLAQAARITFRRAYVVRAQRDPAHQARAEALGEVAPGEDTYEQVRSFAQTIEVPAVIPAIHGDRDSAFTVTDPLECLGKVCLDVKRKGQRPTRERDV